MIRLESDHGTASMIPRFSSKTDEEGAVIFDPASTVVAKYASWNSAHVTHLRVIPEASLPDCWTIHIPQQFPGFSLNDRLDWTEEFQGLAVAWTSLGVFFRTALKHGSRGETAINKDSIRDEAKEEGFEIPTNAVLKCAEVVLSKVHDLGAIQSEVEIYPMPNGEVAVDVFRGPEGNRSSVIFLCGSADQLQCLTHINGKSDQKRIRLGTFPDGFVRQAFTEFMEVR